MGTDALPPTEGTTLAGALSRVENFEGDSVVTLNEAEAKALWEELQRLRAAPEPAAERLTLCLQAIMADLADLLDADQFNNIEARVMAAGVPYPPLGTDPRDSLTKPGSYGLNCPHDKDPDDCARCSDG